MNNAVVHYAEGGEEFYPTPAALIDRMLSGIDWRMVRNILEPSAGKGDIVHRILMKNYTDSYNAEDRFSGIRVDCIEIDPHLTSVLKYNFSHEKAMTFQPILDMYKDVDYRTVTPDMKFKEKEALREKIRVSDRMTLTQPRHLDAVRRAVGHLEDALRTLDTLTPDLAATDLQAAQAALAEITGDQADERLLDEVFSRFCVGK